MSEKLKIVKIFNDVKLPVKQNFTDSGFDLYAYSFKKYFKNENIFDGIQLEKLINNNSITLEPNDRILIGTGIKATVGSGFELQIRPRSGLALKQGLTVLNTPGTVDSTYFDEIGIIIINLSNQSQIINLHDRVAQLVVCPVILTEIEIVSELVGENRGGGFGHTGVK